MQEFDQADAIRQNANLSIANRKDSKRKSQPVVQPMMFVNASQNSIENVSQENEFINSYQINDDNATLFSNNMLGNDLSSKLSKPVHQKSFDINRQRKQNSIKISGFQNFWFGNKTGQLGNVKDKKQNSKIRVKRQSQKLQEGEVYNAKRSSIATINIEGDQKNMIEGQLIGVNTNQQIQIKTQNSSDKSPEPSTGISNSPPLISAGSGSNFYISQKSPNSIQSRSPNGTFSTNVTKQVNQQAFTFQSPILPDDLPHLQDQILMNESTRSKKITRNPFSSQRRKRSEPNVGQNPQYYQNTQMVTSPSNLVDNSRFFLNDEFDKKQGVKNNEALNLINPKKFIQQNNFIPVPSMMMTTSKSPGPIMNQFAYGQGPNIGGRNNGFSGYNGNQTKDLQPSMLLTSPNFFNFFESGENMTQERFTKSREQAKRNRNRTQKPAFVPSLNRINTIGQTEENILKQDQAPSQQQRNQQDGIRARSNVGSAIICAPQGIIPQGAKKSPFPRRTRILSQNDNGELAASEEQGGSSDRSGSNGIQRGLMNYRGEGIINVSSEILNSFTDNNDDQLGNQLRQQLASQSNLGNLNQNSNHQNRKYVKAPKKQRAPGQRISRAAINFLDRNSSKDGGNFILANNGAAISSVQSVESLSPTNSIKNQQVQDFQFCDMGIVNQNTVIIKQVPSNKTGNLGGDQNTMNHNFNFQIQQNSNPQYTISPQNAKEGTNNQKKEQHLEQIQSQNGRKSQIKKQMLVIPKKMINTSHVQQILSPKQLPFQSTKQAQGNKRNKNNVFNKTMLQLSWTSLHSTGKVNNNVESPRHKFGSNGSSNSPSSRSPSNRDKKASSPYVNQSPAHRSDHSSPRAKHNQMRYSRSPSSDSNCVEIICDTQQSKRNVKYQKINNQTSKQSIENIYISNNQPQSMQSLQPLSSGIRQKHKGGGNNAQRPNLNFQNQAQAAMIENMNNSRQSQSRKKSVQIGAQNQNQAQIKDNILQTNNFGF